MKSGSKNIRGLGILPYGNLRDMPVAYPVNFSPCVMTWAVLAMKQIINIIHFLKNKTIDKQLNTCLNVHMRNRREKWNDPIK